MHEIQDIKGKRVKIILKEKKNKDMETQHLFKDRKNKNNLL